MNNMWDALAKLVKAVAGLVGIKRPKGSDLPRLK